MAKASKATSLASSPNGQAKAHTRSFIENFKAARRAAVPILAVNTADVTATIAKLAGVMAGNECVAPTPLIGWNCLDGFTPLNPAGRASMLAALAGYSVAVDAIETLTPRAAANRVEALRIAKFLPGTPEESSGKVIPGSVLFMCNMHKYLAKGREADEAELAQAIFALRDEFKIDLRMVILLGSGLSLPAELRQHVLTLSDELPKDDELANIAGQVLASKGIDANANLEKCVGILRGVGTFAAEQVLAMSTSRGAGVNFDMLTARKRETVNQTPGLTYWDEAKTVSDLGGCAQIVKLAQRVLSGRKPPRCVVHVDEIEKALAGSGAGGDSSGVSANLLGMLLSEMSDRGYLGLIALGVPGTGKSLTAKVIGSLASAPTIRLDMATVKQGLVGASENNLREALDVISAVSGGDALFVATSNNINALPAELIARFRLGTFFYDIPTAEERASIWQIWLNKYDLGAMLPAYEKMSVNWVGREIEHVCEMAWRFNAPIVEMADYVTPVYLRDAARIESLRTQAENTYLSASYPGTYKRALATVSNEPTRKSGTRANLADII